MEEAGNAEWPPSSKDEHMWNIWPKRNISILVRQLSAALLFVSLCAAQEVHIPVPAQALNAQPKTKIMVPAGTQVTLALTTPIMARSAAIGQAVYTQTAFPVTLNNQMAIPAGTYVQGQIVAMKRPGFFSPHAEFQFDFTKIIFANGYTVVLPQTRPTTNGQGPAQQVSQTAAPADDVIPAVASPYVDVTSRNDILLDNGAQFDMVLQVPLRLNASLVANATKLIKATQLPQFRSASSCRDIPGTPGTPDTVIPGTPATPGTPDTVIPGVNGAPDTVIPGIPPTPGTPDIVIPGSPGTPDIVCPGPPVVVPGKAQNYKESFQIGAPAQAGGKQLAAGSYQVTWKGPGPVVQVEISQNGKTIASVPARFVLLNAKSGATVPATQASSDGSIQVLSLRFSGQSFALYFDQKTA
jgi:hypothetical protein